MIVTFKGGAKQRNCQENFTQIVSWLPKWIPITVNKILKLFIQRRIYIVRVYCTVLQSWLHLSKGRCEHLLRSTNSFMQGKRPLLNQQSDYLLSMEDRIWMSNCRLYHWQSSVSGHRKYLMSVCEKYLMPAQREWAERMDTDRSKNGFWIWTPEGSDVWCGLVWTSQSSQQWGSVCTEWWTLHWWWHTCP